MSVVFLLQTTQIMHCPVKLSHYMYLYYNFSSGALITLSPAQGFDLLSLFLYCKFISILMSTT